MLLALCAPIVLSARAHNDDLSLFDAESVGALTTVPAQGPRTVPKRIFTYWSDPSDIPDLVAGCIASMRAQNPAWTLHILYPGVEGVEPPPAKLSNACCGGFDDATHLADWYRAAALARYGGVWLDSTTIHNRPIEDWARLDLDAVQGWEWVSGNNAMENWAFAAPEGSRLMAAWTQELRSAWQIGPERYCANIQASNRVPQDSQALIGTELQGWLPYLTMHAAFVLAWSTLPGETVRFLPSSVEPGQPFAYLADSDWVSADALHRIFFEMSEAQVANVSFFKLRGDERHAADSLANYAAQGSRLAARMLARLPNVTRAGTAASS